MTDQVTDSEDRERKPRPWTVMVYMVTDGDAEMDGYAVKDLREMEKGANDNVDVAIQIKRTWPDKPQRYIIRPANGRGVTTLEMMPPGEVTTTTDPATDANAADRKNDMGRMETLGEFMTWAIDKCPAENYMLVLWGHAYGLGFGRDHGDPLQLSELVKAIDTFRLRREGKDKVEELAPGQGALEILGANSCAMSYIEAAFELRNSAKYLLASQIYMPFAGWPYEAVLQSIHDGTDPEKLGKSIIRSYVTGLNAPLTGERVQMSLLNLAKAQDLPDALRSFVRNIRQAFKGKGYFDSVRRAAIRDAFIGAAAGDVRPLVDLLDLCRALLRDVCDVKNVSLFGSAVDDQSVDTDPLRKSVLAMASLADSLKVDDAAHVSLSDLGGIGIYVPFVTDDKDLKRLGLQDDPVDRVRDADLTRETSRETYRKLSLFAPAPDDDGNSSWPKLVYDDLNEPISPELVELITNIGVTSVSDRAEITQIVLSIDSAFNALDRLLDVTRMAMPKRTRERSLEQSQVDLADDGVGMLLLYDRPAPEDDTEKQRVPALATEQLREWLRKVEVAVGRVERATKRGLTQARFGLGPVLSPRGFSLDGPPKPGDGAPKPGDGPPKPGDGPGPREEQSGTSGFGAGAKERAIFLAGSADPEVRPVLRLFIEAARALQRLEAATRSLEHAAGRAFGRSHSKATTLELAQTFVVLRETSTSVRRIIRRIIANPAYGLGPGQAPFDLDDREELANAAGMSSEDLLLLAMPTVKLRQLEDVIDQVNHAVTPSTSQRRDDPVRPGTPRAGNGGYVERPAVAAELARGAAKDRRGRVPKR